MVAKSVEERFVLGGSACAAVTGNCRQGSHSAALSVKLLGPKKLEVSDVESL